MKKIALATLAVAAGLVSQHAVAQSKFEGLSFSAGLGMVGASTTLSGAMSSTDTSTDPATTSSASGGIDFGKTNTLAVLDLGYGVRLNPDVVLGLGATLDLGNTQSGAVRMASSTPPMSGDLISLVGKKHYSVYLQPTWLLTPDTGVFVKVGYHTMKRSQDGLAGEMLASQGISTAMNLSGMGYGMGVKTYVTKNVFVQAEASTVSYKSKDLSGLAGALGDITAGNSANLSAKVKTTSGIISIGMNF